MSAEPTNLDLIYGLDWDKIDGHVMVVFQKEDDDMVMAIDIMSKDQVAELLFLMKTGRCSRSRASFWELWRIYQIFTDCESNTLLVKIVIPENKNQRLVPSRFKAEGSDNQPWFGSGNVLVPAAIQDVNSRKIRMVGVVNAAAFAETKKIGKVTFWSRTKGRLWTKGEGSGHCLYVREILVDKEGNTLLITVDPVGPTCHTDAETCFENKDGTMHKFPKERNKMSQIINALRLLLPDGSMEKVVLGWLAKAGFSMSFPNSRVKRGLADVPFIKWVTSMRPQEIPVYLAKGLADIAFANEDWIRNWASDLVILLKIPAGRATRHPVKIVLAVSKNSGFRSIKDLPINGVIATEYVELAEQYLRDNGRQDISIIRSYGGTEQKIIFGADAIIELTETGSSLVANDLIVIDEIMVSNTVIAVNREAYEDPNLRPLIEWFVRVIEGVVNGEDYIQMQANVPEDKLDQAIDTIGGMLSPTKNVLAIPGWYELSSYIEKARQHEIIFQLLQLGVQDICVSDNVSMVMGQSRDDGGMIRLCKKGGAI